MTTDEFLELARRAKELGATAITAGEFSISFGSAAPRPAMRPLETAVRKPEPVEPVSREEWRKGVKERLNG